MDKSRISAHNGKSVVVRPARVDDAATLVGAVDTVAREGRWFLRGSFNKSTEAEAEYIASVNPKKGAFLVALVDGALVGWLTLDRGRAEYTRHTAEIGMGILAPYRGIGIGTALLEAAIEWGESVGIEKLCLGVRASNERAQRLYTRMGFVEEGRRRHHIKDPEGYDDDILMALFLTPSSGSVKEA